MDTKIYMKKKPLVVALSLALMTASQAGLSADANPVLPPSHNGGTVSTVISNGAPNTVTPGSYVVVFGGVYNSKLNGNSKVELSPTQSESTQPFSYSELNVFSDSASLTVNDGAKSDKDRFTGNAVQTISNGGSATATTFSDHASQILEDGATSENTTFNDNASGLVGADAQMSGNTTLNGNSILTVLAANDNSTKQLENVTLNNSSRLQLLPTGSESHEVMADTITMNGGSIAFGHEAGAGYTTLFTREVNGSGGNLIMNGNLADHNNDQLVTDNIAGKYNIHLNN